jgi:hypothetical protein
MTETKYQKTFEYVMESGRLLIYDQNQEATIRLTPRDQDILYRILKGLHEG